MDYYPTNEADLIPWAKNMANEAAGVNEKLKLPSEDVSAIITLLNTMTDKIDVTSDAISKASKLVSEKSAIKATAKIAARAFVKQVKASPNYTDEIGRKLGIYVAPVSTNLEDYKPVITVKETGGHIQISFTKSGIHGLSIYSPQPGSSLFVLLGVAIQSPFIDPRPLAQAGVAELRQYKAMAIEKNVEVGQWSEVVSVSFSG